jgi:hypothetical protein
MSKANKPTATLFQLNNPVAKKKTEDDNFFTSIFVNTVETLNTTLFPDSKALLSEDSGKTFYMTQSVVVDLPKAAEAGAGWNAEFIVKAAPITAPGYFLSSSDSSNIYGAVANGGAAEIITAADVITFVNGESKIGDRITLNCDGTNFYAQGIASASAGVTSA